MKLDDSKHMFDILCTLSAVSGGNYFDGVLFKGSMWSIIEGTSCYLFFQGCC